MTGQSSTKLIAIIRNELQLRDTDDLLEIWQTNDREAWTAEAFEAIRLLLLERLGQVPPRAVEAAAPGVQLRQAERQLDRAKTLEAQGKHAKALDEATAAIRLAPRLAAAHHFRGLLLDADHRLLEAIRAYREAIRLDPQLAEAAEGLRAAEREWLALGGTEPAPDDAATDPLLAGDYSTRLGDLPDVLYLSETARTLPGWPGYRTRPGRSGYDYLDTQFELAHAEGVLLRQLFTGQLRTRSMAGLVLLAWLGLLAELPLMLGAVEVLSGASPNVAAIVLCSVYWVPGLFLLWNVAANAVELLTGDLPSQ